jgi:hypothetical protein
MKRASSFELRGSVEAAGPVYTSNRERPVAVLPSHMRRMDLDRILNSGPD